MKTVTVFAFINARRGKEAATRKALLALIPITRQEPGCITYDLHMSTEHPGHFVFHENWASKQHLDDHLARPHLTAFAAKADELLVEPPLIALYEQIG